MLDASIDDLVARCQASSADCTPLCEQVFWRSGDEKTIKSCQLTTENGALAVKIVFEYP